MKWNWGTKIAVFYIGFVVFILGMVALTFTQKNELVTEDYYARELAYQETIDKERRTNALPEQLRTSIEKGRLVLLFPHDSSAVSGQIMCLRPSDKTKDFAMEFDAPNGYYAIPLEKFISGKYQIDIDWTFGNESYRTERTIVIPL